MIKQQGQAEGCRFASARRPLSSSSPSCLLLGHPLGIIVFSQITKSKEVKHRRCQVPFSTTDAPRKVKDHPLKTRALFPVPSSVSSTIRQLARGFLEATFICSFIQEFPPSISELLQRVSLCPGKFLF